VVWVEGQGCKIQKEMFEVKYNNFLITSSRILTKGPRGKCINLFY